MRGKTPGAPLPEIGLDVASMRPPQNAGENSTLTSRFLLAS